jgi:hypothetical protein
LEFFMPAMANLLVKDDAATPKEWTLIPITDTPSPIWRANDSTIPLEAQPRLTESAEQQKNGVWKITAKLEVPVLETLGASGTSLGYVAPPKVAYVTSGIFSMFCDPRSTSLDRANVLKMMTGILQGASSTTATGTLNQASAGSAFLNSTAQAPQLFTQVIIPN